jgi:hypothetical protein
MAATVTVGEFPPSFFAFPVASDSDTHTSDRFELKNHGKKGHLTVDEKSESST